MFLIRKAGLHEFDGVRSFYHSLIDEMRDAQYKPGWEKGVYPSDGYLSQSIARGELWLGMADGQMAAAMIVNHDGNESYHQVAWPIKAEAGEVTVIHALGVHPDFAGRGYAKAMAAHTISQAAASKQKAVRLDVLAGNIPAEKLYTGLGFQYVDTLRMYYEDTGWTDFQLYEYRL